MSSLPFIPTSEINARAGSDDYASPLGIQHLLITRPASTFLLRSDADRFGVSSGDILIVDRSLRPRRSQLVVAVSKGELVLQRFPVAEVWGAVTYVVHKT